jgi:hypothetical protein
MIRWCHPNTLFLKTISPRSFNVHWSYFPESIIIDITHFNTFFEREFYYVAQDGLQFIIFLLLPPKCWIYQYAPPSPT